MARAVLARAREGYQQVAMVQEIARCHQDADINLDEPHACKKLAVLVLQVATTSLKRPADDIGNAARVMQIATGEIDENAPPDDGKDRAAKVLGAKGGAARAKAMTPERRAEIAKKAAAARWKTQ